jgi:hypothetical protein
VYELAPAWLRDRPADRCLVPRAFGFGDGLHPRRLVEVRQAEDAERETREAGLTDGAMTDDIAPNGIGVGGGARCVALDLEAHKVGVLLRLALRGIVGRVPDKHETEDGRKRERPGEDPLAPSPQKAIRPHLSEL